MPLSFLNPAFLWGLGLTSIPIIIHLLMRRRYRVVRWGAMEFLLLALKKRSRRLRIEQLLLLLIRTLVILLVVLAICRPAIRPGALPTLTPESHVHALLVVDNSYSMGYRPEGGGETLFDRARRRALDLVRLGLRQGDALSLILASDPAQAVIRKPSYDLQGAATAITNLALSDAGTNFTRAAQVCLDILNEFRTSSPGNPEIYYFTDNQATGWETAREGRVWEQLARTHKARLSLMLINEAATENMAIAGVQLARGLVTSGTAAQIRARIANHTPRLARSVLASLEVDGRPAESARLDVQPATEGVVTFTHVFDRGGTHTAVVRLTADRLARDDTAYLSLRVRDAVKVLLLNGRPDANPKRDAGLFLAVAMDPPPAGPGSEETALQPTMLRGGTFGSADLRAHDVVALSNVSMLVENDRKALARFVQGGGGALVFLGDQVDANLYNRDLYEGAPQLLPARIARPAGTPTKAYLDGASMDHPALQRFRNATDVEVGTAEFRNYFTVSPRDDPSVRVMARFTNGEPALVERRFGLGKVVLCATAADLEWSDLPLRPSFLPLVHQLVTYLAEGSEGTRNVLVGDPLVKPIALAEATRKVTVTTPAKTTVALKPLVDDRGCTVTLEKTPQAGFYQLAVEGTQTRDTLSVNLATKESNLRFLSEADLANLVPAAHWTWVKPGESIDAAIRRSRLGIELWRICLFAALILMLIETALAQVFGRRA